jgi:hypothetical protein
MEMEHFDATSRAASPSDNWLRSGKGIGVSV